MLAALTTDQKIQLAIVIITGIAALAAVATVGITVINEQRRTQPIVIAHESHGRRFSSRLAYWVVGAYLTSEGGGPAFNVRFGVEWHGVRYPYKLQVEDPDSGAVQRVLPPGARRPDARDWPILIDSTTMWGAAAEHGDPDPTRAYWARYENARGQVWETRNPGDRSARLDIRRVRFAPFREWAEARARHKAGKRSAEWERQALEELRGGMEGAEDEGGSGDRAGDAR